MTRSTFDCPHCHMKISPIRILLLGVTFAPGECDHCQGQLQIVFTPPLSVRTYKRLHVADNVGVAVSTIPIAWFFWSQSWLHLLLISFFATFFLSVVTQYIKMRYLKAHASFVPYQE